MKKVRKGRRKPNFANLETRFHLGKQGGMQELEESLGDRKRNNPKTNRKTEYKNQKFGFGGQKKNSKKNTADSSADVFNKKPNKWQRPSFHAQKGKKVG
jgi:rRNA-processing protein EBP2